MRQEQEVGWDLAGGGGDRVRWGCWVLRGPRLRAAWATTNAAWATGLDLGWVCEEIGVAGCATAVGCCWVPAEDAGISLL